MTKEITKAFVLQEIQDKFKLRELVPEIFAFSEVVLPTYDIGRHLEKIERIDSTISISAGPVPRMLFTVPQNERWTLHRYNVIFMTGSYTIAGLMIGRPSSSEYIYLNLTAGISTSYAYNLPQPVLLDPGHQILLYIDGYTSTGNLSVICDVVKEEIR